MSDIFPILDTNTICMEKVPGLVFLFIGMGLMPTGIVLLTLMEGKLTGIAFMLMSVAMMSLGLVRMRKQNDSKV